MKDYNIDLHYHSPYAAACSKNITIPILSKQAKIKGLDILTTADILHPKWKEHVRENIKQDENGSFYFKEDENKLKKTYFILGVEIESLKRVHHLIYFKDFNHINLFVKKIKPYLQDMSIYGSGRPKVNLTSKQLLDIAIESEVLIGPAHAFTPYFGVYAHYDSLKEAYGENYKQIKFLELGLSADTNSANKIPELKNISFFSFSDSHSPYSFRIGREYVNVKLAYPNFESLKKLINKKDNHKINYNVGYNPKEGKYFKTACRACKKIYSLEKAKALNWKCENCKKTIKKGVLERTQEIAKLQGNNELKDIIKRPEYKYLIPLAQVIQIAINQKNILHKSVLEIYNKFIEKYTEIEIMQKIDIKNLEKIDYKISKYIKAFRNNWVSFYPGGAGHYGIPYILNSKLEKEQKDKEINKEIKNKKNFQKTLF